METVETGDKNRDDFHCMQMSLVMSIRFILFLHGSVHVLRLVLTNFLFSPRDINLTLGLLPPRRHVVWRDSVDVERSGSGLKIIARGYFKSELSLVVAPY